LYTIYVYLEKYAGNIYSRNPVSKGFKALAGISVCRS